MICLLKKNAAKLYGIILSQVVIIAAKIIYNPLEEMEIEIIKKAVDFTIETAKTIYDYFTENKK